MLYRQQQPDKILMHECMCMCVWGWVEGQNCQHPAHEVGRYKQGQWGQITADKLYFLHDSWKYTVQGLMQQGLQKTDKSKLILKCDKTK